MAYENAARNLPLERPRPKLDLPSKMGGKIEFTGRPRVVAADNQARAESLKEAWGKIGMVEKKQPSIDDEFEIYNEKFNEPDLLENHDVVANRSSSAEADFEIDEDDLVELQPHEVFVAENKNREGILDARFEARKKGSTEDIAKNITATRERLQNWRERRPQRELAAAQAKSDVGTDRILAESATQPFRNRFAEDAGIRRYGEMQEQANACFREAELLKRFQREMDQILEEARYTAARSKQLENYVDSKVQEDRRNQEVKATEQKLREKITNAVETRVRAARNLVSSLGLLMMAFAVNEDAASGKMKERAARLGNQDVIEAAMKEGAYAHRLTELGGRVGELVTEFAQESGRDMGLLNGSSDTTEKAGYARRKDSPANLRYNEIPDRNTSWYQANDRLNDLAEMPHIAGKTDDFEAGERYNRAEDLIGDRSESLLGLGNRELRSPARQLVRETLQDRFDDSNWELEDINNAEVDEDGFTILPGNDGTQYLGAQETASARAAIEADARGDKADLQRFEQIYGPGSWDNPADFPSDPNKPVAGRGPTSNIKRFVTGPNGISNLKR